MKANFLITIAAMTIVSILTVNAADEPRNAGMAVVSVKGSDIVKVIYKAESAGRVKVNVYNSDSKVIFTQQINRDGFILPLNFNGLEYGEYTIEVMDNAGKKVEKFSYQPATSNSFVHVTKVGQESGKYLVSVANAGDESITVRIYDGGNTLLHTETRQISGQFAQLYSVKNINNVTIEVTDKSGKVKTVKF